MPAIGDAPLPLQFTRAMKVRNRAGESREVSYDEIKLRITGQCDEVTAGVDIDRVVIQTIAGIYDGISTAELDDLSARICASLQSVDQAYDTLAGRILMSNIHKTIKYLVPGNTFSHKVEYIQASQHTGMYTPCFLRFVRANADALDAMIDYSRDMRHNYFSVRTMERGYLVKVGGVCVESPQDMWMRVSVAVNCPRSEAEECQDDDAALLELLERIRTCYDGMSRGLFTHATPTLFNAGMSFEQMSSCYLLGTDDSLDGIYRTLANCAQISKWAGGIGVHVSNVRAKGSRISSTNGSSDGLVPMLKVFNETARYCNQSGRRKGSICIYLEPWHADVWEFMELRRNTGAETERTRDLFLALWVPDLFMHRVVEDGDWFLMTPDVCPGLQDTYGQEFDTLYERYVAEGLYVRQVKARALWHHMLQCQMETGTPYVLFKDSVNHKCNQKNLGTIKSSNLCAEITEFSDSDTYAVCNLASIAVNRFVLPGRTFDFQGLHDAARVLTYNLNRIIDANFYPTPEALSSNMSTRPIGIGVQGMADLLCAMGLAYEEEDALALDAAVMETIYHGALEESIELARMHGAYGRFDGSPFSRGELQMDLWDKHRTPWAPPVRYSGMWDWDRVRKDIVQHGARNSMLTALMPTASTSQILGNSECFEPNHSNMFKRTTIAGEFMVVNKSLMADMTEAGTWDDQVMQGLLRSEGSVQNIPGVPERLRQVYKTVWEIPQRTLVDHAVARAPFVDQSQSMNLFFATPNSQKLSSALIYAWKSGLKTGVYYLRSKPATEATRLASAAAPACVRGAVNCEACSA